MPEVGYSQELVGQGSPEAPERYKLSAIVVGYIIELDSEIILPKTLYALLALLALLAVSSRRNKAKTWPEGSPPCELAT